VTEVLLREGRLTVEGIRRQTHLSDKIVIEVLTSLIQHGLVRWATVDEGNMSRTIYECFFEEVYPLLRYGKEIQLVEKHAGAEVAIPPSWLT
jgi:RNA polymerase III subunit RPC82 helix-turn-helix domain